jgi:hypothetical protein
VTPGEALELTIACSRTASTDKSGEACHDDPYSLHTRPDGTTSGCALAISYLDFASIQPADLMVISALHDCPHTDRKHTFQIPDNLPAGNATMAWMCALASQAWMKASR